MNVQPSLPDNPKYRFLKTALKPLQADGLALEFLVRLWGHCQEEQRGEFWRNKDGLYVEAVCDWKGAAGALFAVLVEIGWVDQEEDGVRVRNWDENNSRLVTNWANGPKGGRPKNPLLTPAKTHGLPSVQPKVNRGITPAKTIGKPIGVDRSGRIKGRGEQPPADFIPPSEAEVIEAGKKIGAPEEVCKKFWHHFEKIASPKWTMGGRAMDWQGRLEAWWQEDRLKPGLQTQRKNGRSRQDELDDVRAELQCAKDPEKIERLKKRWRELTEN